VFRGPHHARALAALLVCVPACLVAPTVSGDTRSSEGADALGDESSAGPGDSEADSRADSHGDTDTTDADSNADADADGGLPDEDGGLDVPQGDLPCCIETEVLFSEVTLSAGITHTNGVGLAGPPDCLIDTLTPPKDNFFCSADWVAAGAAVADVDVDGWVDLAVTRIYDSLILYRNRGDGSFEDITSEIGLAGLDNLSGALFFDLDNDGDQDLYLTTISGLRHHLMINHEGFYEDEALARGATLETGHPLTGTTAAAGGFDNDGYLDLYVGDWRNSAIGLHPSSARLLHNRGALEPGAFEDVTDLAGVNVDSVHLLSETPTIGTFVLTANWGDLDGDGWVELLLTSDFGCSRLFWNNGDGTFLDKTLAAGVGTDESGMGSALADIDRDGDLDWFVSSVMGPYSSGNRLYINEGERSFSDQTDTYGVRDGFWGWGAVFFDQENDGDLDLAMTNGWRATLYSDDPIVSWTHEDGTMVENPPEFGLVDDGQGRGFLGFDYDRDGDIDLFLANNGGPPKLWRNDTVSANRWLKVDVEGTISNRDGLGARIEVSADGETQLHEVGGSSQSFLGHSERSAHFGVGSASKIDQLRVTWPASGIQQVFTDLPVNQRVLVVETP